VGNFLVVIPPKGAAATARQIFHDGLHAAQEIRSQTPVNSTENEWAFAASFARQNGSGGALAADKNTGSWLLSTGTWFHNDGYSSGSESRLLQRYFEIGAKRLARELEGFFVLILGDAETREVLVLTDLVGSCHCFQRSLGDTIVLSGSSLLLASLDVCHLDSVGCQEFIYTGIIYEDRTCQQEVRKLRPATVYRFADGKQKSEERYWLATDLRLGSLRGRAAVDRLWETATGAAKRIRALYSSPVCDLTGGYDSRSLVAAFLGAGLRCSTAVSGSEDSADVRISVSLASEMGLPHVHNQPLRHVSFEQAKACLPLTDGEYDLVDYAQIREIHRTLAQQFDISINGSFGEVARGYWWELLLPRIGARVRLDSRKLAKKRYAAHQFDSSVFPPEQRLDLIEHFVAVIERTNAGLNGFPNTFQMDHAYIMMRMQRWQGRIASSTNQIWPCLSPFMFRSILETMLETGPMLRWRSLMIRKMLARFSPVMAAFPLEHGFPAQPSTWKNFYKFLPLANYFSAKIAGKLGFRRRSNHATGDSRLQLWGEEAVRELLRPAKMKLCGFLEPAALRNFLERSMQERFAFGAEWSRLLSLECALQVADRARLNLGK
jgi:hypothetical protein